MTVGRFKHRGQVALIMVLILAVGLIFLAITMNWGRIAQYKTITTMGANLSAAQMGSAMASYGEQVLQTSLGGKPKICKSTGILVAIIALVIVIIVVIVTWGAAVGAVGLFWAAVFAVITVSLALASLIVQAAIIQPGLTKLWNKMQESLSIEDQIIEQGITVGLQTAMNDPVVIQDEYDLDMDGFWADEENMRWRGNSDDQVSRFGYHYTQRLKEIRPRAVSAVENFQISLREFVYGDGVTWALTDPPPCLGGGALECSDTMNPVAPPPPHPCCEANPPAECNPCCQPVETRPLTCHAGIETRDELIAANLPPPDICLSGPHGPAFPLVYNPHYENDLNRFLSFKERLGVDDEFRGIPASAISQQVKSVINPNAIAFRNGMWYGNPQITTRGSRFRIEDTSGYMKAPVQAAMSPGPFEEQDRRFGVFPFLWKMATFGINLSDRDPPTNLDETTNVFNDYPNHCQWCDDAHTSCTNPPLSGGVTQLNLVNACNLGECCAHRHEGYWTDKVTGLDPKFLAANSQCSTEMLREVDSTGLWWKPGGDRYCSPNYPYHAGCAKHGNTSCQADPEFEEAQGTCDCEQNGNPTEWPDDPLDDLVYGLDEFLKGAKQFIKEDRAALEQTFTSWYDGGMEVWVGTECPAQCVGNPGDTACERCGRLRIWRDWLRNWAIIVQNWLYNAHPSDADTWCVPSVGSPQYADMTYRERVIIESNPGPAMNIDNNPIGNPWGDLRDVIQCLDYNAGMGGAPSNSDKFTNCSTCLTTAAQCSDCAASCLDLPRSLVGGFAPNRFNNDVNLYNPDPAFNSAQEYQDCLGSICWDESGVTPGRSKCLDMAASMGMPLDCNNWGNPALNALYAAAVTARDTAFAASVVCADPATEPLAQEYRDKIAESADLAVDQVTKMDKRRQVLRGLMNEAEMVYATFKLGYERFRDFLCVAGELGCATNSPATELVAARVNAQNQATQQPEPGQLTNFVIYGWQSETRPVSNGRPRHPYWHIVRVEAFAPKRCYGACGVNRFPWVRTYKKGFLGMKRCYELTDHTGYTMSRVTRWDENHEASNWVRFANGLRLWQFRFNNPAGPTNALPAGLASECAPQCTNNADEKYCAFMINHRPDSLGVNPNHAESNPNCWQAVQERLARGVVSTSCTRYFLDGRHLGIKFVPCEDITHRSHSLNNALGGLYRVGP